MYIYDINIIAITFIISFDGDVFHCTLVKIVSNPCPSKGPGGIHGRLIGDKLFSDKEQ
jgi:hypothetical protein